MAWMDGLQRRFGFLALPGLGRAIVGLQVLCFAAALADPRVLDLLALDPARVAQGEYWRLLTFVCVPSLTPFNVLFAVFFFMFQWTVFEALEAEWGAFKLTLYCALGWLCALALPMLVWAATGGSLWASGGYWSVSIELAFATVYPETMIYVYLILPVKMKWMAWLIGAFLVFRIFTGGWGEALPIGVGLLNYLAFFGPEWARRARRDRRSATDRRAFERSRREAVESRGPRACAACAAGPEAFLRLCTCPACGPEGKFWCERHLDGHRGASAPKAEPEKPAAESAAPKARRRAPRPSAGRGQRPG